MIDANILIDAKNQFYPFGLVPGFWTWFRDGAENGDFSSIVDVRTELYKQEDQLSRWVKSLPEHFWKKPHRGNNEAYGLLSDWANTCPTYTPSAVQSFLGSTDYRLIAESHASGLTLVSNEASSKKSARVRIPDACDAIDCKCITVIGWLHREATRFEGFGY